jgi:uncharacterized membrane protein
VSETGSTEEAVQRDRDLERLLTFVDAIVAIAITLLVLPLVDIAGQVTPDDSVSSVLHHSSAQIGAFLLSFAVIANLWLAQHRTLSHVVSSDQNLVLLLLLWSLTIVFLPFPTALITGHEVSGQAATKMLYVGTMAASTLILTLVAAAVRRDRSLRDTDEAPDYLPYLATLVAFVLALVLMLLFPALSYWPMLLLLVRRVPLDRRS